jgi:hypothetical protein
VIAFKNTRTNDFGGAWVCTRVVALLGRLLVAAVTHWLSACDADELAIRQDCFEAAIPESPTKERN